MTTSAPFQRVDPQGVVFDPNARTLRFVPVTASSDRALNVAIQPPMQATERMSVVVQGLPSGARVEITPSASGTEGKPVSVAVP